MTSLKNLLRYAKTGVASKDMTAFDKMLALQLAGENFSENTITGVPPISFKSDGTPLISMSIIGNGQQIGSTSPQNIIMPDMVGKKVSNDWTIPISCGGKTTIVYLGQTATTRRIKKAVLTGTESWSRSSSNGTMYSTSAVSDYLKAQETICMCSHYAAQGNVIGTGGVLNQRVCFNYESRAFYIRDTSFTSADDFKAFLAEQYANGTPVLIWYVLANAETATVNEPLAKIGTYYDELSSDDAGIQIPTAKGNNILIIGTDLQPSSVSITGHIIES